MRFTFFIAFLWVIVTINAQETTGSLEGKIVDENGNSLANVQVTITDTETNFKY